MTNRLQTGFSTIEMLIALSLVVVVVTAVVPAIWGSRTLVIDSQLSSEALHKSQELMENALVTSRASYDSVVPATNTYVNGITYVTALDVPTSQVTACSKQVKSRVTWVADRNRSQQVELTETLTNVPQMLALGGACDVSAPTKLWNPPATWASSNFNPGKPTALAALNRMVYIAADKQPFLYISNTASAALGQSNGLFLSFANGFSAGTQLNDIKVAKLSDNNTYAFVARNANTNQFQIIRVTDPQNPVSVGMWSLKNVDSKKSFPQGFRVFYYSGRVYITTRETTGPELHVFDVSNPASFPGSVTELGNGKELNRTVEDFVVQRQVVGGTTYYFAYMATDKNGVELSIFDVTDPTNVKELDGTAGQPDAEPSFTGGQDGASVALLGTKLYFGRLSASGADLYVFDASNPLSGNALPTLGSRDVTTSVIGLAVSGQYVFVGTSKANSEFQVFRSDPTSLALVSTFNFPNVISRGGIYESDWVYVASQGNDALRIIYSPN